MPDPTAIDTDYNLVREERLQAMLDGEFQRGVEGLDADPSAPPEFIIAHAKGSIVGENNARKIQGLPPLSDDEIDVRLSHAARAILPAQQHEDPGVPTGTSVLIDAARGAKRWGSVAAGLQEPSGIAEDVVAAPVGIAKGAMHVYDKAIDEPLTAATTSVLGEHGRDVSTALQLFGPGAVGPGLSNAVKGTLQLGKAKAPEALAATVDALTQRRIVPEPQLRPDAGTFLFGDAKAEAAAKAEQLAATKSTAREGADLVREEVRGVGAIRPPTDYGKSPRDYPEGLKKAIASGELRIDPAAKSGYDEILQNAIDKGILPQGASGDDLWDALKESYTRQKGSKEAIKKEVYGTALSENRAEINEFQQTINDINNKKGEYADYSPAEQATAIKTMRERIAANEAENWKLEGKRGKPPVPVEESVNPPPTLAASKVVNPVAMEAPAPAPIGVEPPPIPVPEQPPALPAAAIPEAPPPIPGQPIRGTTQNLPMPMIPLKEVPDIGATEADVILKGGPVPWEQHREGTLTDYVHSLHDQVESRLVQSEALQAFRRATAARLSPEETKKAIQEAAKGIRNEWRGIGGHIKPGSVEDITGFNALENRPQLASLAPGTMKPAAWVAQKLDATLPREIETLKATGGVPNTAYLENYAHRHAPPMTENRIQQIAHQDIKPGEQPKLPFKEASGPPDSLPPGWRQRPAPEATPEGGYPPIPVLAKAGLANPWEVNEGIAANLILNKNFERAANDTEIQKFVDITGVKCGISSEADSADLALAMSQRDNPKALAKYSEKVQKAVSEIDAGMTQIEKHSGLKYGDKYIVASMGDMKNPGNPNALKAYIAWIGDATKSTYTNATINDTFKLMWGNGKDLKGMDFANRTFWANRISEMQGLPKKSLRESWDRFTSNFGKTGNLIDSEHLGKIDKVLAAGFYGGALGFNEMVAAGQLTALLPQLVEFGPKNFWKALNSKSAMNKRIWDLVGFTGEQMPLAERAKALSDVPMWRSTGKKIMDAYQALSTGPMTTADMYTRRVAAAAGYYQAYDAGKRGDDLIKAAAVAVGRMQGLYEPGFQSAITANPVLRAMKANVFTNFPITMLDLHARLGMQAISGRKTAALKLATLVAGEAAVAKLIGQNVAPALQFVGGPFRQMAQDLYAAATDPVERKRFKSLDGWLNLLSTFNPIMGKRGYRFAKALVEGPVETPEEGKRWLLRTTKGGVREEADMRQLIFTLLGGSEYAGMAGEYVHPEASQTNKFRQAANEAVQNEKARMSDMQGVREGMRYGTSTPQQAILDTMSTAGKIPTNLPMQMLSSQINPGVQSILSLSPGAYIQLQKLNPEAGKAVYSAISKGIAEAKEPRMQAAWSAAQVQLIQLEMKALQMKMIQQAAQSPQGASSPR